jgi:dipeptide/tripeptide permease
VAADAVAVSRTARFTNGRDLFGQPRGLFFIGATELWERISFHGMQALLILYMAEQLLLPGHVENIVGFSGFRAAIEGVTGPLSSQALASQIFGLYVGSIYLVPVFGGLLGDRVLGRRRAVALGAHLMTAGHFCMAFEASFLAALLLLVWRARSPARCCARRERRAWEAKLQGASGRSDQVAHAAYLYPILDRAITNLEYL